MQQMQRFILFIVCPLFIVSSLLFLKKKSYAQMLPDEAPVEDHEHPVPKHQHPNRPHLHEELGQIRRWLESIERDTERRPIITEEKEPRPGDKAGEVSLLQTLRKTRLDGGMTFIAQGGLGNEKRFGGDRAEGSLSIDLILESELRDHSLLILRGDFMRGDGLTRLPALFAGGVNADIEDFSKGDAENPETFHLIEALFERTWEHERYRFSIGQIDLTSYFDQNQFANSETFQFLSPLFVNNAAITWGGDTNGYGPGFVMHFHPLKTFELNLGVFEGDGNYAALFEQPFVIVEIELEHYHNDLEGHYRFIFWLNELAQPAILDASQSVPHNRGFALSFDEALSARFGLWARFGLQEDEAAAFDRQLSLGFQFKQPFGRLRDVLGVAVGGLWAGDAQEQATGLGATESIAEIYYNATLAEGIRLSPDIQYILNPGGDATIDPVTVYGLRAQYVF